MEKIVAEKKGNLRNEKKEKVKVDINVLHMEKLGIYILIP